VSVSSRVSKPPSAQPGPVGTLIADGSVLGGQVNVGVDAEVGRRVLDRRDLPAEVVELRQRAAAEGVGAAEGGAAGVVGDLLVL
jgi:hypothetical protein